MASEDGGISEYAAALIALAGVLLTAFIGLYLNFFNARGARKQPFLLKQLELCHDASLAAARLATLSDRAEWLKAEQRFWELFYGPLSIVEDLTVKRAMEEFAGQLEALGPHPELPASMLGGSSYRLARAIRVLILNSWSIKGLAPILEGDSRPTL